ncbi:alpha/beta hydrolase [Arthrobacter sp. NamB2]|uniref:alpha/beta hydrolase n=1 Tax=Arthrobacter sp. NamB2 TaxID=2576035 RepID=UPI0010C9BB4D|nr:alpha/beta hydrolase [Arthrobacter sp. NamB2]TKV28947.1 alpha/beta hydrolase [Arthrobacter sp. NamB2]
MTTPQTWPHLFEAGTAGSPVLLLLHGTGGDEHDLLPLADRLAPGAGYLAPRGPVQEHGMNRWFRRFGEGVFDVDDVVRRAAELAGFVERARSHYGFGDRQLVAVGFSNGANIALAMALLHPQAAPRTIAFSGMYPLEGRTIDADLSGTAVALFNGTSDAMAPIDSAIRVGSILESRGAEVDRNVREGGHGIHPTEVAGAAAWITSHTKKVRDD